MIKIDSLYKNSNINSIIEYINLNSDFSEFREKFPVEELKYLKPNKYLLNVIESNLEDLNEIQFVKCLKSVDSDYRSIFSSILLPNINDDDQNVILPLDTSLIGRDEELQLLEIFMNRKYKNNVILVGEPGVGKTALIREYSKKSLKPIIEINLSEILSDTKYRGEFEKKISTLIKESIKKEQNLFIDEIHVLIQAGGVEGGIAASNILKPFLTDEHFQIIGATTRDESKLFFKDKALERRFNFLSLSELPKAVLFEMFYSKISMIKNFEIMEENRMNEVFAEVIETLDKILPQRNYPDKLLDFLDFFESYIKICGSDTLRNALNFFEKTLQFSNFYEEIKE